MDQANMKTKICKNNCNILHKRRVINAKPLGKKQLTNPEVRWP